MSSLKSIVVGVSGLMLAAQVLAQAPISDMSQHRDQAPIDSYESAYPAASAYPEQQYPNAGQSASTSVSGSSASVLNTVNQLQEEVAMLRGQVEELTHQMERLKQQQLDDYARLDAQLAGGSAGGQTEAIDARSAPVAPVPSGSVSSGATMTQDGKGEYEAAYNLLKQKKFGEAEVAFNTLISNYPNSTYAGNANFWLGFIYQTRGDLNASEKAFNEVLKFPNHNKAEDAKYNLGKVYHLQGKTEQARQLLTEVAAGSSNTASLAKTYLATM